MKKVSLVTPLRNETQLLERGLQDLESFVRKYPLEWELILVIDPSSDLTLQKAQELKSEKFEIRILSNPSRQGRGPSVRQGLEAATGDFVMIFPLDFTIPLADLFNFLQELVLNPGTDLAIGNRNTSRKKREAPFKTSWHWTLESIILEKLRPHDLPVQDPLCPYLIFQKSALRKLLPHLKLKSWFYTPEILKAAIQEKLRIVEVPVLSRDPRGSQIPLVREYFRNLF
jgi:glycosyltransferase involved in cell wall biosynthesis